MDAGIWLDFVFDSIKRYIHRFGHRMVQSTGTLSAVFVSVDEARLLLGGSAPARPPAPALQLPPYESTVQALARSRARLEAAVAEEGPLAELCACFGLDQSALELLLAAAAPLMSTEVSRLYGFAWADFAVKLPTVGFLGELIGADQSESDRLQAAFLPDGPLVRYRLVELRDGGPWGDPAPLLYRGVVVPEGVLRHLGGVGARRTSVLPRALHGAAMLRPLGEGRSLDALALAETTRADLEAGVARALRGGRPRLLLVGPDGVGRQTALTAAAAVHERAVLEIDLSRAGQRPEQLAATLAEAGREALLRRCVLLLQGDAFFGDRSAWERLMPTVAAMVNGHRGPVALTALQPVAVAHRDVQDLVEVAFPLPEPVAQKRVWQNALGAVPAEARLAAPLASRFNVSPGTIHTAVVDARARHALTGGRRPMTTEDVARAVRQRLDHALSEVAEPFTTSLTWDDVILPDETRDVLDEIIGQARYREQVFDGWGFRRKMAYGRGLSCLFIGPPGTGKTMVTALIAKTLGRELYRVDLARVVSKWIGETEKNLARVFDEAEKAQVILLFDEADALFGSRTEVKGSNDRFANMEINYLLQRMESFDGMSLLTTNFAKSIDEAFKRRLKFRVDFPMPDADQRTRLWAAMLPEQAETSGDLGLAYLGKRFKMAGGNIKNAVLRAAFYAAEEGRAIDAALLERAALAESREMGRLF